MSGYAQIDAYPQCLAVLQALKARGFVTAILSNGSPEMLKVARWFGFRTCCGNRQGLPFVTIGEPPHHVCDMLDGALAFVNG